MGLKEKDVEVGAVAEQVEDEEEEEELGAVSGAVAKEER